MCSYLAPSPLRLLSKAAASVAGLMQDFLALKNTVKIMNIGPFERAAAARCPLASFFVKSELIEDRSGNLTLVPTEELNHFITALEIAGDIDDPVFDPLWDADLVEGKFHGQRLEVVDIFESAPEPFYSLLRDLESWFSSVAKRVARDAVNELGISKAATSVVNVHLLSGRNPTDVFWAISLEK